MLTPNTSSDWRYVSVQSVMLPRTCENVYAEDDMNLKPLGQQLKQRRNGCVVLAKTNTQQQQTANGLYKKTKEK